MHGYIKLTAKSVSEAVDPQYDDRLFMKIANSEHTENMLCTEIVLVLTLKTIFVHNMFSACSEIAIFMNNPSSYCDLCVNWFKNEI